MLYLLNIPVTSNGREKMAKLNYAYESFSEYLRRKLPFVNYLYYKFVAEESRVSTYLTANDYYGSHNMKPIIRGKGLLLGPLQSFLDIRKDFIDTLKPYKAPYQALRDLSQPIRGLINILKGVISVVASPLVLLVNLLKDSIIYAYWAITSDLQGSVIFKKWGSNAAINLARTFSWVLDGLFTALRGVTQIVATPLTWLIKRPLRGIITAVKGVPKIEESKTMQRLANEGHRLLNEESKKWINGLLDTLTKALHIKFVKANSKGQPTNIKPEEEQEKHGVRFRDREHNYYTSYYGSSVLVEAPSEEKIRHARAYFNLFSPVDVRECGSTHETNEQTTAPGCYG
jgi:hypothetical protein